MYYSIEDKVELLIEKLSTFQRTMPLAESPREIIDSVNDVLDKALVILEEMKDELEERYENDSYGK